MLGLRHGQAGARKWRQVWSDHRLKHLPVAEVALLARQALAEYAGAVKPELLSQLD
jgi:tRNA-dihydrouridine synthase A